MMTWEYKLTGLRSGDRERHLNELGAEGWALLGIDQGTAILQRPREISKPAPAADPHPVPARVHTKSKAK